MLPDKLSLNNELFFSEVTRMLRRKQTVILLPKGNSMFPFIQDGRDKVVLKNAGTVKVGDIVLAYIPGKRYVLHRVYKICGRELILMGDGNLHDTELCRIDDVFGTVVKILRNGQSIECASPSERRKAMLWRWLLPVRRYLLFICKQLLKADSLLK